MLLVPKSLAAGELRATGEMVPTATIVSPERLRNKPVTGDGQNFIAIVPTATVFIATVFKDKVSLATASLATDDM